jgi:large subunit ribosomal protein L13
MIIDATNLIVGRLATFAAKQALLGETVDIINAEKAVVSGSKKEVLARYMRKVQMGNVTKGPYLHRAPDRLLRRTIRGMLPYKQTKGIDAFRRMMCHVGVPAQFEGKESITIEAAKVEKLPYNKFLTLREISKHIKE